MAFGNLTSRSKKQTPNHHSHGVPTGTSQRQQYRGGGIIGVVTNNSNSGNRSHHHHHHHRSTTMPVLDKYNRGGRLSCCRSVLSKVLAFFVLMAAVYALYTRYVRLVVVVTHDAPETHHSTGFFTATTATPPIQIKTVATPIPLPKTNEFAEKVRVDTIRSIQTVDLDGADGVDGPEQQSEDEEGANVVQDTNGKVRRDRRSQDDDTDEIPNIELGLITKQQQQQPEEEEESEQQDAKLVVADGHMGDLPLTIKPQGFAFSTFEDFERHRTMSEAAMKHDVTVLRKVITAYMEPPLQDTVPNTGSRGDLSHNAKDKGVPPDFVIPLPRRTHTPNDLLKVEYPAVQTCQDMPGKFPVDRGLEIDSLGQVVVWNVGNTPTPPDFPEKEAQHCPVELDPFLPWIHDVFPSQDGSRIEFIAQNKRRCRTGAEYSENVNRLVPQVALMQPVSVEKISETKARELAPDLWQPETNHDSDDEGPPRYRLAPYEEASPNGMYTRFICRFHMTTAIDGAASVTVALGETLSEFPFNYEYINYRKDQRSLLSPKGKDTILFWTSNIRFSCPMPDNAALRHAVANGNTVLANGTPTVYVDVIPIRTSVRYNEIYLTEDMIGPKSEWGEPIFDPVQRWGPENVLPRVEASGRWANIPICLPPELVTEQTVHTETEMDAFDTTAVTRKLVPNIAELPTKPHFLVGCLWASAEFKTRGKDRGASTDTIDRLQEWIEFHLMVGFDHIYVYDNSGAHTNETSLEPTVSLYPGKVTRIDWPSIVCNNNIPAHDSTGERSSQYAAENSCRTRYGPFTQWLASFDTDEYFVPMGNYTNLKDVLIDVGKKGTNILSLQSSRGRQRIDKSIVVGPNSDALEMLPGSTFLEAYNCDSGGIPKPSWTDRARKQIYRPDYVLYHFVHYSTVTRGYLQTYDAAKENGEKWERHYREYSPSERASDELSEVVMVHTKTLGRDMTFNYNKTCRYDYDKKWQGCWVAYPWPYTNNTQTQEDKYDENGMEYNCYVNQKVDDYWVPKLREALQQRKTTTSDFLKISRR